MPQNDKSRNPAGAERHFETERRHFLPLLLANPNYFGNLKDSKYKGVKQIISNTTYEQLMCVGYNPQLSTLEGVVSIKQSGGYSGSLCTNGSTEYVRFYLSYDNGATWLDQGLTGFSTYDVPAGQPFEMAVSLNISPMRQFCDTENLPLVRGILSWNQAPTDPTTPPVWGNMVDVHIQVAPIFFLLAGKLPLFAEAAAKGDLPKLTEPQVLSPVDLAKLYKGKQVPAHRFLNKTVRKITAASSSTSKFAINADLLAELEIDASALINAIFNTDGDTSFEQLDCVGYAPGAADALEATLHIKQSIGYNGSQCTTGSQEYVAFWVDWGSGWEYQGTTSVNVHDFATIPADGLSYAVYQPVNFNSHRKPCGEGAVTPRMRAILSWDVAPPPANPDFVPSYGNRLEGDFLLEPGTAVSTGDFTPYFDTICSVAPCNIDQTTGFAPGDSPFGSSVSIFGIIPGAPLFTSPLAANQPKYKVTVQQIVGGVLVGTPQPVADSFGVSILQQIGAALPTSFGITQFADGDGFFTYQMSNPNPGVGWRFTQPLGYLCDWNTTGKTGLWQISLIAKDPVSLAIFPAGTVLCTIDGTTRQSVIIDIDNAAPVTSLAITGFKPGGVGACQPAVNCGTFTVGDVICGSYSVSDEHFGSFSLSAEPTPSPSSGFTVDGLNTNGRSYPAVPTNGQSGVWTYDTAGLPPCGYTVQLSSNDRTIVGCGSGWENNSAFVGFCLVPKK